MVRIEIALALALAAAPGGATGETRSSSPSGTSGTAVPGTASAQVPGTAPAATATTASGARPGHERAVQDDYPSALAEARRRGLPLLVEVWAPW